MTLEIYAPEKIDHLALRLLDIACDLREISSLARENNLSGIPLHDKKALEFLSRLEEWTGEVIVRSQTAALKQRATRRALGVHDERDSAAAAGLKPARKTARRTK
jgi:hypothetical protein